MKVGCKDSFFSLGHAFLSLGLASKVLTEAGDGSLDSGDDDFGSGPRSLPHSSLLSFVILWTPETLGSLQSVNKERRTAISYKYVLVEGSLPRLYAKHGRIWFAVVVCVRCLYGTVALMVDGVPAPWKQKMTEKREAGTKEPRDLFFAERF
jgi:hypothetical protein